MAMKVEPARMAYQRSGLGGGQGPSEHLPRLPSPRPSPATSPTRWPATPCRCSAGTGSTASTPWRG
uniref:Uncharacterized protein n=1 Tax=Anguilla anguilla TaxID=7936 RepID=A0A0E9RA63_ANGAN